MSDSENVLNIDRIFAAFRELENADFLEIKMNNTQITKLGGSRYYNVVNGDVNGFLDRTTRRLDERTLLEVIEETYERKRK